MCQKRIKLKLLSSLWIHFTVVFVIGSDGVIGYDCGDGGDIGGSDGVNVVLLVVVVVVMLLLVVVVVMVVVLLLLVVVVAMVLSVVVVVGLVLFYWW